MNTVTIPKKEYQKLKAQSQAYRRLTGSVFESIISNSPTDVAADFRQTGLYTEEFLADLESGLHQSSF